VELDQESWQLLEASFLFQGVPREGVDWAADRAHTEGAAQGTVLYAPERFQRSLGLVLSGQVRVTRGELVVALLERGDWFGAAALFNDREEFPSTLTAVGACQALYLSQETVAQLLERWPAAAENYIRYLSGRIGFLSDRLNSLSAGTAEEKVKQFLLRQADETGTVTASADDLAKALGLGRASIYRAFESLAEQGFLSRRGRTIRLARTKNKME
jgi:CRP-like cAMP-binding protein